MKKLGILKLASTGPVLSTRIAGRKAADQAQDAMTERGLVVSFAGIEIATPSYLDELMMRLSQLLRNNESLVIVIAGLNNEVRESLLLVLDNRKMRLAVLEDEQIRLLGGTRQLQETLAAAQKLGSFKAPDLAKELKVKLPNLHQRLAALLETGALTRERDESAPRGRQHNYEVTEPDEVDPNKIRVLA